MNDSRDSAHASNAAFEQYLAAVRARRNSLACVSCGAMLALLVFAWISYGSIRSNFSHEKLVENGQRVGESVFESAQPQLIAAAKQLVPVYRDEAERALRETLPLLQQSALEQLKLAQKNISAQARAALEEAAIAPVHESLRSLMDEFPAVRDEQFVNELLASTESTLHEELTRVLETTHEIYRPQIERLSAATSELRSEKLAAATNDELMQRFIHLWIMLIDTELMGRAPCSVETLSMLRDDDGERGG